MAKDVINHSLIQPAGRVLPTLEADGRRRWLTPRLGRGRFLLARRLVAYALIALFTLLPFVTINGMPAVLLDVIHRRFTLFGYTFLPTDTMLLAILLVAIILGIFFFTALAGRVWCGWACPQTVYMEFLFRPIERLCMGKAGVGGKPNREVAGWRLGAMYLLFVLCSLYLAHTFLSYFVGVHELRQWMTQSPARHPAAFVVVALVTAAMLFDFAYFREQMCLIACPYGRLQSVLLDRDSLIIQYDKARGEPRGKALAASRKRRADEDSAAQSQSFEGASLVAITSGGKALSLAAPRRSGSPGDCVDCSMCVQVCPTGIDIRDGLQFECIACAQCIDACDAVMDKLRRPRGLIRYGSQAATAGHAARFARPRVVLYAFFMMALISLLTFLILFKSPFDVHVTRQGGMPFVLSSDGMVRNILRLNLTNRTDREQTLSIELIDASGVSLTGDESTVIVAPGAMVQKPLHLLAPRDAFAGGKRSIVLRVRDDTKHFVDRRCQLFGPRTAAKGATP